MIQTQLVRYFCSFNLFIYLLFIFNIYQWAYKLCTTYAHKNMHQAQVLTVAYPVEIFAYLTFKAEKEDCKDFICKL